MFLRIKTKFKVQKTSIAFFTIILVLLATALVQVPCPVCEGTGVVSNTGMGWVRITNMEATATGVYLAMCATIRVYMTDIALMMQNDGEVDGNGYVSMILLDYKAGKVLDNQLVQVSVPANMQVDTVYTIYFQVYVDDPRTVKVNTKVLTGNVPDKACNGTGRVALNSWPVFNVMKDRFMKAQLQNTVTPLFQPFFLPPEDWDVPFAYDRELTEEAE